MTSRDTTKHEQTEAALSKSEWTFRAIFDQTFQFMGLMSVDGIMIQANRTALDFIGKEERDVKGKPFWETPWFSHSPELQDQLRAAIKKAAGGEFIRFEVTHPSRDGSQHFFDLSIKPVKDNSGNVVLLIPEGRDITNRKLAEQVLLKNDRLLRRAEEMAKFGNWEFLLDEKKVHASEGAKAIYGLEAKEWRISEVRNISLPEYRPMLAAALKDLIELGIPYNVEFKIRRPADGQIIDIHSMAEYDAAKNMVFGVIQDITERKRAEEERTRLQAQLLQAQKMDAIGQVAGGVAHDFNNILTAMSGYCFLARMKLGDDSPGRKYLDEILELTDRAASLTKNLLAFSRKQALIMRPVSINTIVSNMSKLLLRVIGEDIRQEIHISADDIIIMADGGQIEQVLMNLATNARDAMPQGGVLTVRVGTLQMDDAFIRTHGYGRPGLYAAISVEDTGIGMTAEVREKIFEPFFTTKEEGKGTGLGLAIVYGIVQQHNGFIGAHSEPGKGADFEIYIPAVGMHNIKHGVTVDVPPVGGTETILLVEDESSLRTFTMTLLAEFGYRVIEALDGRDAVDQFMKHQDDIQMILMDVIMPNMSGPEAYQQIQDISPGAKVLFMSGYTADYLNAKGIDAERSDFLSKPASTPELLRKIREILDRF